MSKNEGKKIVIKFTEDLVGDVELQVKNTEVQDGDWTANGTYSGTVDTAKDDNIGTYWQSRSTANYIQIVRPNTKLLGIMVYKGSRYRPSDFTLSTSDNGIDYINSKTGSFIAATGWETIMFNEPVTSDYLRINFGYSSRLYLYELVLIIPTEFTVTGQEYKYVQGLDYNGELINKTYKPINVEKHPTVDKAILLSFSDLEKFNNVKGNIKVEYDALVGNLSGRGGRVESFIVEFAPTDLISTPNPGVTEIITVAPVEVIGLLNKIDILNRYATETITVAPVEVTGVLTDIGEINP